MKDYKKKIKKLKLDSRFYTLAVTAFLEHLPDGPDALIKAIKFMSKSRFQIIALFHNKTKGKPHYHVLVRVSDSEDRQTVSTMLQQLHIQFRPGIDDNYIRKRGLETCGSFAGYATYLLHKTVEAKLEGKAEYEKEDFITNLTPSDIEDTLDGYTIKSIKITKKNMPYLLDQAHQSGLEQKSFSEFMDNAHILWPSQTDTNKLRKAHESGLIDSIQNANSPKLCIQILTEYSEELKTALQSVFSSIEFSSATGKVNNIDSCTKALIISIKNMSVNTYSISLNTICDPNSHIIQAPFSKKTQLWTGDTIILIDNYESYNDLRKDFDPETKKYKPYSNYSSKTPFCFVCGIKNKKLVCLKPPTIELHDNEKDQLIMRYKKFKEDFEKALSANDKTSVISLKDLN